MFKQSSNLRSIQRHFRELNTLLIRTVGSLSGMQNPTVSRVIQDITQVSQSLIDLEQKVDDQLKVRQSQLGALMGVGRAINSALGLNRVLEEVMDTLIALMRAERGFLMLRDSNGELSVRIARGLDHINLDEEAFRVSQTIVERVAASGEPVLTTNAQEDPRFENQMSVAAYHLRSILCAPLKLKSKVIGVLYVENRAHAGIFQENDLGLISAFADQAAVAIDNARLFDDLQRSNRELEKTNFKLEAANLELKIAYDATLNGWVHALDLRDKETEGHTQRVTILTERLARVMGVEDDQLLHIRRGALLHDIGKMAIPDGILLKQGPLTDEERALIQEHPTIAYKLLRPIEFLSPAIHIPYCHHEKWDGTGYPLGLRKEEIPFDAHIFAVIDVWDALTSDRPYRQALPHDEVRRRIKVDAGRHFDPHVVDAFLEMEDLSV
ncbi:MAG: HD domain-containing phosphohydrolase [Anaerolineales bacterium]